MIFPRMILVLASYGAVRALAWTQADPVGAVETGYMALLVAGVLTAVAFLAPPPAHELHHAAWLAPAAAWAVGYGPHRGAVVTIVLALALIVAAARSPRLREPGAAVAMAVGLQWLLRPDLLLPPLLDLRTLVSLAALPAAAGLALYQLARSCGHRPAAVAGLTAVVLAPGWNVTTTLALVALAAGTLIAKEGATPIAKAGDGHASLLPLVRGAAGLALLGPPLWDPVLGTLFSVGGAALLLHLAPPSAERWADLRRYATLALGLFATFVALRGPVLHGGTEALRIWAGGLVLLPVLAVILARRETSALAVRGIFLAFLATLGSAGPEALAGGLALAALALPAARASAAGDRSARAAFVDAAGVLQAAFSTALLVLTLVLASYPWVRQEPLRDGLALVGLEHFGLEHLGLRFPENLAAAGLLVVVGGALVLSPRRLARSSTVPAVGLVALLVGAGLAWSIPTTVLVPIANEAQTLADGDRFHARFPSQEVSGGILDANLIRGAGLPLGTPVAVVRLHDSERHLVQSWELLAGIDTGEWAAARRDIADRPGFHAPSPWLSQVAPGGLFFAQRFRARFRVDTAREHTRTASVSIRRHPDLPPHVELVVYRLELRR